MTPGTLAKKMLDPRALSQTKKWDSRVPSLHSRAPFSEIHHFTWTPNQKGFGLWAPPQKFWDSRL